MTCLHVTNIGDPISEQSVAKMRQYYTKELDMYGPIHSRFVVLTRPSDKELGPTIVDFANLSGCDFIAIAPRARGRMSSVSSFVANEVECNLILCKS